MSKSFKKNGHRWIKLAVLEYDVNRGSKTVLRAGTKNVAVAYRAAQWTFTNSDGEIQRGNLYRYRGKVY